MLLEAYEHSINAVFCNIGKKIGAGLILDKAKDFGFYSKPPIELPSDEVAPSGLYNLTTHSLYDNPALVDPGRLAFGQEHFIRAYDTTDAPLPEDDLFAGLR